jgi:hypothetical protein
MNMKHTHIVTQTKVFLSGSLTGITVLDTMRFYNVDDAMDWCCKVTGNTYRQWNDNAEYVITHAQVSRIEEEEKERA